MPQLSRCFTKPTNERICIGKIFVDTIVADWDAGVICLHDPGFYDVICALPVTCCMCNRFIFKKVKTLVDEEFYNDTARMLKENSGWIARNWNALRYIFQILL